MPHATKVGKNENKVLGKDRKKTLFWHFQTLVARGILLSPLPYYLIEAPERNKAADVARNVPTARAASCLFRFATLPPPFCDPPRIR